MTETEIRAYTAGYNFAFNLLKGIIEDWAGEHHECQCSHCAVLHEIAEGKFGGQQTPDYLKN